MKEKWTWLGLIFLLVFVQTANAQTIGRVLGARGRGVVLQVGQKAGVEKGQVFFVYRDSLRAGKLKRTKIARVQVVKTFPKISVARIVWLKPQIHIKKGDVAVHTRTSFWGDYFSSGNLQMTFSFGMNKLYPTDLNRALVQQGSVYGVDAKSARFKTGSALRIRLRGRLPFHLSALWEGDYLSTAAALQKSGLSGKNVAMNWNIRAWSSQLGLAFNIVDTHVLNIYVGTRVGVLIADLKFLNTFGSTYDNAYFEETNVASGLFSGLSYKPGCHVVLTIETGYDFRGLGHLQGYRYTPGKRWDHYIPRTALTENRIHVDLSGVSVLVGIGARL